jgi:V8-like Glu-specific endopeptidase
MKAIAIFSAAVMFPLAVSAQSVTLSPKQAPQTSVDFSNAKPMPLPQARTRPMPSDSQAAPKGPPGSAPGGMGSGQGAPATVPVPRVSNNAEVLPQEAGTSNHPFTTALVDESGIHVDFGYPARAAGKLFFNIPGRGTFVCSASMIKPGVVVTAAHCVANFGQRQFYNSWIFVPAYYNGNAPFGVWTVASAAILSSYYDGSDSCAQAGVICQDDVALLVLNAQSGHYAGNYTGWYGYGWNGYSYFPWQSLSQAEITQLGYPVALDGGLWMERTDSLGYNAGGNFSNNTIIGSLMTGGSSGGPWLVNFGLDPSLSGTAHGSMPAKDIVVGVTSWGYIDLTIKEQGAAPFTSGNIVVLVNYMCSHFAAAC